MNSDQKKFWPFAALIVCAALYIIWPTAHTIALRKLLLILGAVIGIVLWVRSEDRLTIIKSSWMIYLILLFAWVLFHVVFLSQNGNEAWIEFLGQWIPAYFSLLVGIGLALASSSIEKSTFRLYLLTILAIQPVLYLVMSFVKAVNIGHLPIGYFGPEDIRLGTDLKMSLTLGTNMLAGLSCAKFLNGVKTGVKEWKLYLWLLPIAGGLFVAILSDSLNGILLTVLLILLTTLFVAYYLRAKIHKYYYVATILIIIISLYSAISSPTVKYLWQGWESNTRISMDIAKYPNWMRGEWGYPLNVHGEKLPMSFYYRVARATAGVDLILENPLGYGVTRHAFERLLQKQHPEASVSHAENGYINLVCAVGFPGLILLVLAIISIYKQLKNSNSEWAHPAAWMIGVVAVHWALDAIDRDHFFEIYLFIIGLLGTLTLNFRANNKVYEYKS